MKFLLVFILLICSANLAFGTIQAGDKLSIGERELSVYMFNLSPELAKVVEKERTQGGKRVMKSGNWDGFYAKLEVRDRKLFLRNLSVDHQRNGEVVKKEIPLDVESGLFCSWFSGELRSIKFGDNRKIDCVTHFYFEDGFFVREEKSDEVGIKSHNRD